MAVLTYTMPFWILPSSLGRYWANVYEWAQRIAVAFAFAGLIFIIDPLSLRGWAASSPGEEGWPGPLPCAVQDHPQAPRHRPAAVFIAWQTLIGSIP